eukprot:2099259-Rhodomonas_salina.1
MPARSQLSLPSTASFAAAQHPAISSAGLSAVKVVHCKSIQRLPEEVLASNEELVAASAEVHLRRLQEGR